MANDNVMNPTQTAADDDSAQSQSPWVEVKDHTGAPVSDFVATARQKYPDQFKNYDDSRIFAGLSDPKNHFANFREAFPNETAGLPDDDLAKWSSRLGEVRPELNPPGFLARTSEAITGSEHPFSDTAARLKQLVTNPSQFASDAATGAKNFVAGLNTLGKNLLTHPIDT